MGVGAYEGGPKGFTSTVMKGTDWVKRKRRDQRSRRSMGGGVSETGQKASHVRKNRGTVPVWARAKRCGRNDRGLIGRRSRAVGAGSR